MHLRKDPVVQAILSEAERNIQAHTGIEVKLMVHDNVLIHIVRAMSNASCWPVDEILSNSSKGTLQTLRAVIMIKAKQLMPEITHNDFAFLFNRDRSSVSFKYRQYKWLYEHGDEEMVYWMGELNKHLNTEVTNG